MSVAFSAMGDDSSPSLEYGCDHAWTAASVDHRDYGERLFVGRVSDDIIS
jgi:hypothetical protein